MLYDKIANVKSIVFQYDITKILEYISSTYKTIINLGEIYYNLLENTFNVLLTTLNTRFNQYFLLQKLSWQSGTIVYDFEILVETAKTIYNNMVSNRTWDSIDPKDAQILALTTKIEELQKMGVTKIDPNNIMKVRVFLSVLHLWRKVNVSPMIVQDGME